VAAREKREKKERRGILSRLLGPKKTSCCDMRIEEVIAEEDEAVEDKSQGQRPS
jgi:hypothetical protein